MRVSMCFATVAIAFAVVAMAQEKRPVVAVKTFENPANYSRSTIGNALTEILVTELSGTGKFQILERSNVDELTKGIEPLTR